MSRARSLTEVAAHGLCTGCGLCAGMSTGGVTMVMTAEGFLRPSVAPDIDPKEHARLLALCPGSRVGPPSSDAPRATDTAWGTHRRIVKAHALDAELRHRGSSGGVISAIANFLLESKSVEFVLHIAADPEAPLRSRVQLSLGRANVLDAAGARYGPAAPLERMGELLELGLPFAVVGKPCDIAGIRNLARHDPRVTRLVRFTVSFFCAGVSSLRISEQIVAKYGLGPEDVKVMRYRGFGCPGPTHIEAKDGGIFEQTYDETWSEELNEDIQFRCKICPDATGEHADIVCGDAWVTMDGYAHTEHEGWNSVIARSEAGERLLERLEEARAVATEPLSIGDLDQIQPHQVERKTEVLARLVGLALRRQPLPVYRGLRLARNAWTGRHKFLSSVVGTYRRVRRGGNREDLTSLAAPRGLEPPDPATRAPPPS
ncbi:MAG: Coenzyme F420 hydrogenase/dehydrogenase, beta subunit C-terminal domain [Steroidobacteraceae bacterium]